MVHESLPESKIVRALSALGHDCRIRIFRLLARQGAAGMASGTVAERLQVSTSMTSFHLNEMLNAHVVSKRRVGRLIIYSVNPLMVKSLIDFIVHDCCNNDPTLFCDASSKNGASASKPAGKSKAVKKNSK